MIFNVELDYAEDAAINNAARFLCERDDWNEDDVLKISCDWYGFDYDFVWLTSRVLFEPAVWFLKTRQTM